MLSIPRRILVLPVLALLAAAEPLKFCVTFDKSVTDKPFTGRVYVMLSKKGLKTLPSGPSWAAPDPFFAWDVVEWRPGETLVIGANALSCPMPLRDVKPGTYSMVAIMDFDRGLSFARSEGNGYSRFVRAELDPATSGPVALTIDQVYREKPFPETDRVKLVEVESKLLSDFHRRPIKLRAAVVLPRSFATAPPKKYPIIYEIPGFSGTHHDAFEVRNTELDGIEFLRVVLDPHCRLGHHVFADSANNGPCGQALVEELIPAIERKYRAIGTPNTRYLTGHSSGGWSSLWLQITYPDFFGGVWSTAPDPVDFRDFQMVNLYRSGVNLFFDPDGKPRPLARVGNKPVLFSKGFSEMEEVMGHGGQLQSFEAVFSPRGADGRPRKLWDRKTGAVDSAVAMEWQKYDIRLVLERSWRVLGPKLAGKIHVYTGDADTFYLEGATRLLRRALLELGSDGVVELLPGKDHRTLLDRPMRERIAREMAEQFRKTATNKHR
jgi:hypothetical protein